MAKSSRAPVIEQVLTLEEAAGLLQVHQKTVKRMLDDGLIHGCRFPSKRRVYFLASEVERARARGMRKRGRPPKSACYKASNSDT